MIDGLIYFGLGFCIAFSIALQVGRKQGMEKVLDALDEEHRIERVHC